MLSVHSIQRERIVFALKVIDSGIAYEFYCRTSLIEPIVIDASLYFSSLGFGSSIHDVKIVIRELLSNAIGHGSHNSPMDTMHLYIKKKSRKSLFEITIDGRSDSFENGTLEFQPLPDDVSQVQKRGYSLLKELAEEVQFDRNGSRVRVYFKMSDS